MSSTALGKIELREKLFFLRVKNAHQIKWRLWLGQRLLAAAVKLLNHPPAKLSIE